MKIDETLKIRGRAWCREFYEQLIADLMEKIEDMAEAVESCHFKIDQYDLKEKNAAAVEELEKKLAAIDEDIEKFASAIFCK